MKDTFPLIYTDTQENTSAAPSKCISDVKNKREKVVPNNDTTITTYADATDVCHFMTASCTVALKYSLLSKWREKRRVDK